MIRTNHFRVLMVIGAAALAANLLVVFVGPKPAAAAFPGSNGEIAFSSNTSTGAGVDNPEGDTEIFTINPDGTGLEQLTFNATDDFGPDYSPDGKRIVFTSTRDGNEEIYVMKANGSGQENLSNTPSANDSFPVWAPDTNRIAFTSDRDSNFEVYKMKADGSRQENLSGTPADDSLPAWSPKGRRIAFMSDRDGDFEIYAMRPNGAATKNLSNSPDGNDVFPEWAPGGDRLSFGSDRDSIVPFSFVCDIFKMKADGSDQKNLTNTPDVTELLSAWSPNGKQIAFDSDRDNLGSSNAEIFKMKADGSDQKRLTNAVNSDDYGPTWKPK